MMPGCRLLKLPVADMDAYSNMLNSKLTNIPDVSQTHTYVVIAEMKKTNRLEAFE